MTALATFTSHVLSSLDAFATRDDLKFVRYICGAVISFASTVRICKLAYNVLFSGEGRQGQRKPPEATFQAAFVEVSDRLLRTQQQVERSNDDALILRTENGHLSDGAARSAALITELRDENDHLKAAIAQLESQAAKDAETHEALAERYASMQRAVSGDEDV